MSNQCDLINQGDGISLQNNLFCISTTCFIPLNCIFTHQNLCTCPTHSVQLIPATHTITSDYSSKKHQLALEPVLDKSVHFLWQQTSGFKYYIN